MRHILSEEDKYWIKKVALHEHIARLEPLGVTFVKYLIAILIGTPGIVIGMYLYRRYTDDCWRSCRAQDKSNRNSCYWKCINKTIDNSIIRVKSMTSQCKGDPKCLSRVKKQLNFWKSKKMLYGEMSGGER